MGMGDSVTELVFFIAALLLATATVAVTVGAVQGMTGDVGLHAQTLGQRLRSDVRLVNDAAHVTTSPLTLLVKNVGSLTLHPTLWTVLVDGSPNANVTVTVLDQADNSTLGEAQVAKLEVAGTSLATGDHVARVVTETGVADELRFHV